MLSVDEQTLFHVMDGGSNLYGWALAPTPIPTLISLAQFQNKRNSLHTERGLRIIRTKCRPLLLDSGRLTWMRKGLADRSRVDLTPELVATGALLQADVIVAGDAPMNAQLLERVGLSPADALQITWRANRSLQLAKTEAVKGYVIQGSAEAEYLASVSESIQSGQIQDVESGRAIWVIGSVAGASPERVLRVASLVRDRLPGPIHIMGQGRPLLLKRLRLLGINWADTGSAASYAARGKWLYRREDGQIGWKRLHDGQRLPPQAYGLLVRSNMEVLNSLLEAPRPIR